MEDKKIFFERFLQLLNNERKSQELDNNHDALICWIGTNLFNLDPDDVKERIIVDSRAEGIDSILIDKDEHKIVFIQARTVAVYENVNNNFSENQIKLTLEGVRFLLRGDYKGKITPELENIVDEAHELLRTGEYSIKILFLILMNEPVDKKLIEEFNKEIPRVEIELFDFNKIYNFYKKFIVATSVLPEKISFEVITNILNKDSPIKARVFTCKAKEIARIFNEHGERIFQQNVRYLLGLRSKSINYQIMETASSDRSDSFWYFNNGITIICKEIIDIPNGRSIILKKPQIINGAQTTYAIHKSYAEGKLKEKAEVLIKVIETQNKEFMENVTLYTNSQNAIKLRDLCSNDPIQIKIQKVLNSSYKYFLERKRGEFETLYPTIESKKNNFGSDYEHKLISNEKASQAFLALYLDRPAEAKSEKKRIFVKDDSGFYKEIFKENDEIIPEKMLISWLLLKYIEENKKTYKKDYKRAEKLTDEKKKHEIYKFDFILHSEYFILNLFKDFLMSKGFNITKKEDILKLKNSLNDKEIKKIYSVIVDNLAENIEKIRIIPGYYHNKFFKSEKSIAIIRMLFNEKFNFVERLV